MTPLATQFIWHINEASLHELTSRVNRLAEPGKQHRFALPASYEAIIKASGMAKAYNEYFIREYSTDKNVLVLPVEGDMSRNGGWYGWGNEFLSRQLIAAASDAEIKGAVLKFNTGGGTADSTPAFAQTVANFSKVKPIVAHCASCYSAGYFVASQCDEINMEDQATSGVGSIGTLLIYENYKRYLEDQGIDMEIMRAAKSTDKARVNWIEELTPEARAGLQASLDACQKEFEGFVKRGRAGKISSEVFTGKTYNVADALKLGLADSKGDLHSAVRRVLTLAS